MGRLKKTISVAVAAAVFLAPVLLLGADLLAKKRIKAGHVEVTVDGGRTSLTSSEAFEALRGLDGSGDLLLDIGGREGHVKTSDAFKTYRNYLRDGDLRMLSGSAASFDSLWRTALYQAYGNTYYYADGYFRFNGEKVREVVPEFAGRVFLVAGSLPKSDLKTLSASTLVLGRDAEFDRNVLMGSKITAIETQAPYFFEGGALYKREQKTLLVGSLPAAEVLELSYDYCDRGALLASSHLREISVPFVGNGRGEGLLRYLFETEKEATVPESLRKITVRGGTIEENFLYGIEAEEVNLHSVPPELISIYAFASGRAETVHAPRADLVFPSEYKSHPAPCGCTVYERSL